jgi:hypothetical protein
MGWDRFVGVFSHRTVMGELNLNLKGGFKKCVI